MPANPGSRGGGKVRLTKKQKAEREMARRIEFSKQAQKQIEEFPLTVARYQKDADGLWVMNPNWEPTIEVAPPQAPRAFHAIVWEPDRRVSTHKVWVQEVILSAHSPENAARRLEALFSHVKGVTVDVRPLVANKIYLTRGELVSD